MRMYTFHTLDVFTDRQFGGNPLAAGFMLASWAWLKENEPDTARDTRLLMLPKDYTRFRLTGKIGTEPSDASSTLLFDPHRRDWSDPVLASIGLDRDRLPPGRADLHPLFLSSSRGSSRNQFYWHAEYFNRLPRHGCGAANAYLHK